MNREKKKKKEGKRKNNNNDEDDDLFLRTVRKKPLFPPPAPRSILLTPPPIPIPNFRSFRSPFFSSLFPFPSSYSRFRKNIPYVLAQSTVFTVGFRLFPLAKGKTKDVESLLTRVDPRLLSPIRRNSRYERRKFS